MPLIGPDGDIIYGILALADTWVKAGGDRSNSVVINAVAVSQAESSGDPDAVSPSDDYGLWQINSVHAGEFPRLWPQRFDPVSNAKMAIAISGNGSNWGPWCTAWVNPADCGHYLGPHLETGSPAASHLARVAAVLGGWTYVGGPVVDAGPSATPGARGWDWIRHVVGPKGRQWHTSLSHSANHARRI